MANSAERKGFWERARSNVRHPFSATVEPTSSKKVYFEENWVVEHTYTVDRQTFSLKQKEGTKLPRVSQRRLPWSSTFFVKPGFFKSNTEIFDIKAQTNTEVVVSRRARVRYAHAEAPDAAIVLKSPIKKKAEAKNGGIVHLRRGGAELVIGERGLGYSRRRLKLAKVEPGGYGSFIGQVYFLTAEGKPGNPAELHGSARVFSHKLTGNVDNKLFTPSVPKKLAKA